MQCCVNNIKETAEVKKFINEESIEKINPIESVPKHNFIPYPVSKLNIFLLFCYCHLLIGIIMDNIFLLLLLLLYSCLVKVTFNRPCTLKRLDWKYIVMNNFINFSIQFIYLTHWLPYDLTLVLEFCSRFFSETVHESSVTWHEVRGQLVEIKW